MVLYAEPSNLLHFPRTLKGTTQFSVFVDVAGSVFLRSQGGKGPALVNFARDRFDLDQFDLRRCKPPSE